MAFVPVRTPASADYVPSVLLLLIACRPPAVSPDDTQVVVDSQHSADTHDSQPDDTQDTQPVDTGPFDEDGDGYARSEDCNDDDPEVHPGAEETFDGEDDDCDGTVDANGAYSGSHKWVARAWYQGEPHDFTVHCPTVLERELVNATWTVTCTTNPNDPWAEMLVGSTLTLTPGDTYLWDLERWDGDVVVTSSNGWDTTGQGNAIWADMKTVTLTTALDTTYLDFTGTGKLTRE